MGSKVDPIYFQCTVDISDIHWILFRTLQKLYLHVQLSSHSYLLQSRKVLAQFFDASIESRNKESSSKEENPHMLYQMLLEHIHRSGAMARYSMAIKENLIASLL